jgi:hypothetical protein
LSDTSQPSWEQIAKTRELDNYEREVAAREREVTAKEAETKKSRWSSPLVIALLAGAIGLIGNLIVTLFNNRNTQQVNQNMQQVERIRSQSNLILEAIRTGSPEKACTNLLFFIDLGLVNDSGQTIRHTCQTSPSTAPYLPISAISTSEVQTVCGKVASTHYAAKSKGQPTFLNLDQPYPNEILTILIWGSDRAKFGTPETKYMDAHVCVTGKIMSYRGVAEIVATEPSQIVQEK